MNKRLISSLLSLVILSIVTMSMAAPVQAQELVIDNVTFEQLGQGEISLYGPFEDDSFSFALPADWAITNGARLYLSFGLSFNTAVEGLPDDFVRTGSGTLTVRLNGVVLGAISLNTVGEHEVDIPIPRDAFIPIRDDGRMELRFSLDDRASCYDLYGYSHVSLFIHTNSYFHLPHDYAQPDTRLENFPRPIYQNSFVEDTALLVIPDQPTTAELQALMTVASGLGSITSNRLILDLTTLSKITSELAASNHLIYVGKAESLGVLETLELPQPIINGKHQIIEGGTDDGVIQMINSPYSRAHNILVVSGNSDLGTIKAAQALSTGDFLTPLLPNLSIIQDILPMPIMAVRPEDQTLADLGVEGRLFQNRGINTFPFEFYIPPGYVVADDAYFELVYAHSAILAYERSGITVLLNKKPIGSVRMTETTAASAINEVKVPIPPTAVVPGYNLIEVKVNLVPVDICTPRNFQGLWVNLWADSNLHLPLLISSITATAYLDLATFPEPYIVDPTLSNTALILPNNDLESWRSGVQIAAFMGSISRGPLITLSTFYGDNALEAEREKYNLITIGTPSQMPFINEFNDMLPVPFMESNIAPMGDNFQVIFRIPTDSPLGYVETMASPWNSENAVLAILGNQPQGLMWAATSFTDPDLRSELAGNFAVVNDRQILTADTRLSSAVLIDSSEVTGVVEVPQDDETPLPPAEPPEWIMPAIIVLVSVIGLIIVVALIRRWITSASRS
jgi:hypothetical protein